MYNEFELRKFVVPEFVFGINARKLAVNYAANFGASKALVVTDQGLINTGWPSELIKELNNSNIATAVFSNIHANPRDYEVMEGARLYCEEKCNIIIALGGGSVIDCAKGIGIVHTNNKDIGAFQGIDMVEIPGPPIVCIPTTSGSSADVSQFAIIVDTEKKLKMALISKTLVPDAALVDPLLLTTLPKNLIACTAMDALTHGIEAYVSTAQSSITDVHALQSIKLISENVLKAYEYSDMRSLSNLMLGSLNAGMAFSNASLGAVHAMAHSLGGYIDLPHGQCNAVLLKHIIDYNYDYTEGRYSQIAIALGIDKGISDPTSIKYRILDKIDDLNSRLNIPNDFKYLKIPRDHIKTLELNALKDCCMVTNPRVPKKGEMEDIYGRIL